MLLEYWFKKDFKKFESRLDALASRDETKFTWHYTKRAEALMELYSKLAQVNGLLENINIYRNVVPASTEGRDTDLSELVDKLRVAVDDLAGFIAEKSLLFDETISHSLLVIHALLEQALLAYMHANNALRPDVQEQATPQGVDKALNRINNDITKALQKVLTDFRVLLAPQKALDKL